MIRFFSEKRWRLASNNQFFKYSRYAIGEVILVVVGILIALQINTWNEERKDAEKKDFHIQALQNDLRQDTAQIKQFIRDIDRYEPIYSNLKRIIEKEDTTIDTLIKLFSNSPDFTPKLDPQNESAISSLLSTGELKIFDEYESSALLNFYKEMEDPYKFIDKWYDITSSGNVQFWKDYGWLTKGESNWFIYKRARENMDEIEFAIKFDVYVVRRDYWFPVLREISEELLNQTNEMLEVVDSMRN